MTYQGVEWTRGRPDVIARRPRMRPTRQPGRPTSLRGGAADPSLRSGQAPQSGCHATSAASTRPVNRVALKNHAQTRPPHPPERRCLPARRWRPRPLRPRQRRHSLALRSLPLARARFRGTPRRRTERCEDAEGCDGEAGRGLPPRVARLARFVRRAEKRFGYRPPLSAPDWQDGFPSRVSRTAASPSASSATPQPPPRHRSRAGAVDQDVARLEHRYGVVRGDRRRRARDGR